MVSPGFAASRAVPLKGAHDGIAGRAGVFAPVALHAALKGFDLAAHHLPGEVTAILGRGIN